MMIQVTEDFWPVFYAQRTRCVITTQRHMPGTPFGPCALFSMVEDRQRAEAVLVTRAVCTTVSGITVQDTKDLGFASLAELHGYLRGIHPDFVDATIVFIAHFVRVIKGEVVQ